MHPESSEETAALRSGWDNTSSDMSPSQCILGHGAAGQAENSHMRALVQRFIVQGYVLLPRSAPPEVHASVAQDVLACGVQGPGGRVPYGLAALDGDAAGNNLLYAAPSLRGSALLDSPPVTAALRALLGDGYRMHPHCRAHLRQRGAKTTMWHVDAYKGVPWSSGRRHELHDLMVCYYPQDTTMLMGPTELLPGSQYYRGDSDLLHYSRGHIPSFGDQIEEWATAGHPVLCPAGSVVLMHFDLWHRAVESMSDAPRLMLKFVAWRTEEPANQNRNRPELALARSSDLALLEAVTAEEPPVEQNASQGRLEAAASQGRPVEAQGPLSIGNGERCACTGRAAAAPWWSLAHDSQPDLHAEIHDGGLLDFLGPPLGDGCAAEPCSATTSEAGGTEAIPAAALSLLRLHLRTAPAERELFSGLRLFRVQDVAAGQAALFKSAVGEAKAMARRGALEERELGTVIKWLRPQCAAAVERLAVAERAARFVADRRLIWSHVWGWMHGERGGGEGGAGDSGERGGDDGEGGGGDGRCGGKRLGGDCGEQCRGNGCGGSRSGRCVGEGCAGTCGGDNARRDGGSPCAADAPAPFSQRVAMLRSSSEPERLAAGYELSRTPAGRRALIDVLLSKQSSTSERRTAVYGCIAGGAVSAETLLEAVRAAAAACKPDGLAHASTTDGCQGMGCAGPRCEPTNPWHRVEGSSPPSDGGWMPANLIRSLDGFDAESMMAAYSPAAAAAFAATLAFTRSARPAGAAATHPPASICGCPGESLEGDPGESILRTEAEAVGATLLRLLDNSRALSISARLVLLGALGTHSLEPIHIRATARLACAIVSDSAADGSARAVAARVLSQLSARAIGAACTSPQDPATAYSASPYPPAAALRAAVRESVGALAGALAGDADRYVRGHAAEALASIGMLGALEAADDGPATHHVIGRAEDGAGGVAPTGAERAVVPDDEADRAALAALSSAVESAVVRAEAERLRALSKRLRTPTNDPAWVASSHNQAALAVHTAVRTLCAHRRCPLTHPESPF